MHARLAMTEDVPELARLINAAYRVEAFFIRGDRASPEEVRSLMATPGGDFLVIDSAGPGRLAGAVYVETRGPRGHFGLLAVDPTQQGKGLGRRLVAAVETHCQAAGCEVVELEVFNVREELPPFYDSCGYVADGIMGFAKPELLLQPAHLIRMRKSLGARPV